MEEVLEGAIEALVEVVTLLDLNRRVVTLRSGVVGGYNRF